MNQMNSLEAGLFVLFTGPFMGMLVGLAFLAHERWTNPAMKRDRVMKLYETPLKEMKVTRIYQDPIYGRMISLVYEKDGVSNFGNLRIAHSLDIKEGEIISVQTYKYLERHS